MPTIENVHRQCLITKKKYPRIELLRIVKTPHGKILFDPEYKIFGRGIHVLKDEKIIKNLIIPQKRKMLEHFLKATLSNEEIEILQKDVEKLFSSQS